MAKRTLVNTELLLAKDSLEQTQNFKNALQCVLNLMSDCVSLETAAQRIFITCDKKIPCNAMAHQEAILELEGLRDALQLSMNELIALYSLTCREQDRQDDAFLCADDRLNGKWVDHG